MTAPANTAEKAKHTPGPWKIVKSKFGDLSIEVKKGLATYEIVREVGGEVRQDEKGFWSDKSEVEANARLIAEAPELLEAAQPFVTHNSGDETITITVKTEDVRRLRAAIAKATGATP